MQNNYRYDLSTAILNRLLLLKLISEDEYMRIDKRNKQSFGF
jgi:hypothetical protein